MPDDIFTLEIPAQMDVKTITARLATGKTGARYTEALEKLAAAALEIARPAAIYKISHVLKNDGKKVDIDGVTFTSVVLSKLLKGVDTIIPFIVTGGKDLMDMVPPGGNMMLQFYLDTIKTFIVAGAVEYCKKYVREKHLLSKVALMNPGEIEDWHIVEQHPLFSLFNGKEKALGVTLTKGGVMQPVKSRSGIIFPNETGFESCRLCLNANCPGRRVKFDPKEYEYYLGKPVKITK